MIQTKAQDTANEHTILVDGINGNGNSDIMSSSLPKKNNIPSSSTLGTVPFALIVFYAVAGGPFGIEPAVRSGGPGLAILGFLVFPFVWSIPEALMTAELGSTFPDASGGVAWVDEAFGPKAGLIMGWLSWISGATDNAIYPTLFLDYLIDIMSWDSVQPWERFVFFLLTVTLLSFVNYLGLKLVGNVSIVIAVVSMSPFVYMCVVGLFQLDADRWFNSDGENTTAAAHTVQWAPLLNNLFWNLNSFDSAASFSNEVHDIHTVYKRGIFISLLFVTLGYLLPLIVAIGAVDTSPQDWVDGYMATVGSIIGGRWLGAWIVMAAGVSNVGLFMAELSSDSFQLMGMAERGLIPQVFARRSKRFGTPGYAILLCYLVMVCMSFRNFTQLVEMMNFSYSVSLLMEYAAFIQLRIRKGDVTRPYRIPFNTVGCILFFAPAIITTFVIMSLVSPETYIYFAVCVFIGFLLHYFQIYLEKLRCCTFTKSDNSNVHYVITKEEE